MSEVFKHQVLSREETQEKIKQGIDLVVNPVKVTLGRGGMNVLLIRDNLLPVITKDGVSVARNIQHEDPFVNAGAMLVKEVSARTEELCGDGTTTSSVLTQALFNEVQKHKNINPIQLKKDLEKVTEEVVGHLKKLSQKPKSKVRLKEIADISANGDKEVADLDIGNNIPDLTVSDFVKGVLKEFNLTIAPLSPTSFELMPLEDWYAKGRIVDITPHTDIDSIDIQRVPLYKKISFKYQKSESFINTGFADTFGREYGDLEQTFDYDGSDYVVESPFENLLHSKFTGTNLQAGYIINRNFGKYIPKPILLYMAEQTACSFKFNNATTVDTITDYMPFGQDTFANGQYLSLNFGPEISSLREIVINNHIFATYYSNYINNLYVRKNRLVYVKCYLPLALLTSIRLNDRVIIRDKRYVINEMKSNLTTGEVNLVLLLDFRRIKRRRPKWTIPTGGLTLKSPVIMPNGATEFNIDEGATGIVATPDRAFVDSNIQFAIPANPDSGYFLMTEDGDNLDTEDYNNLRSEEGTPQILNIEITYDFPDGSTETQDYPFVISDL